MDNRTRIIGVVTLAAMAVLDSLSQQGVLAPEHAALITDIVVIALPLLGLGALVDVIHTERRRRDPSVPALPDDVTGSK
jgi:hypothetical protein